MKTVSLALALAATLAPAVALADPPRTAPPSRADAREGYGYTFSDDPLDAGGLNASDARILVRAGGIRGVLTRPRTSFVPEMLRSVERL